MADETRNASVARVEPKAEKPTEKPDGDSAKEESGSSENSSAGPEGSPEGSKGEKASKEAKKEQKEAAANKDMAASDRAGTAAANRPYVTADDVNNGDEKKPKDNKKKKSKTDPKQMAKKAAVGQAATMGAKVAAMMAFKTMLKMFLNMIAQAAQAVGGAIAGAIAAIVNAIVTAAAALGVATAVVAGGVGVLVVLAVAVIAGVVISNTANNISIRDDTQPCEEEMVWDFGDTDVSADMEESARKIYAFFHQLGYVDTNISGILGNWEVESAIDPTAVELIYDEPFIEIENNTDSKKWKSYLGQHEACECEWLRNWVERDDELTSITKIEDSDGQTHGDRYEYTDTDGSVSMWEYCWECTEGYESPCEHGFTREHTAIDDDGDEYTCTAGYEHECRHGQTEHHHVAVYHAIDFRMRCLDWDLYDGESEGYGYWSTNTNYDHPYAGIGLAQWTDGRNRMLLEYSAAKGLDWYSTELQLAFMIDENDGDAESRVRWLKNWLEEDNPTEAAISFARGYEGNTVMAQSERALNATEWYLRFAEFDVDVDYAQSIIDMAGATADMATGLAAGRTMDSCSTIIRADNSGIAEAAVSLAWHDQSMASNDGMAIWQYIKDAVLGENDGEGTSWQYKSCDRTVATAVRWSGADNEYPPGSTSTQYAYLSSNAAQWTRVYWSGLEEELLPGDILIFTGQMNGTAHGHTLVYTGNDIIAATYGDLADTAYAIVEGSYADHSPHCDTFSLSKHYPAKYDVFRLITPEENPQYSDIQYGG